MTLCLRGYLSQGVISTQRDKPPSKNHKLFQCPHRGIERVCFCGFASSFRNLDYLFKLFCWFRGVWHGLKCSGVHMIHFLPLIPHMVLSRSISIQFCHFLESPILAYSCQNPPRGAISLFLKTPFLLYPKLFGSDRDLRLAICFWWVIFFCKTTVWESSYVTSRSKNHKFCQK